jgi:RimJ/RimL family protein N-acetyltransferase
LLTERLRLRPITVDDVDLLVALDADPAVMRFISGGAPTARDEAARIVRRSLGHRWIAHDRGTREFIGWFGLRPSGEKTRELGYRLRRVSWGQGLATEGSLALIAQAFTHLGTERIWAQTMTVNIASRRVMEHCGLQFVRTFFLEGLEPIEGSDEGDVEYELTKAEWESRS